MTKRKALGSGLEALLSNKPDSNTEKLKQNKTQKKQNISKNEIVKIPIEIISRNPNQPRKRFTEDSLISLGNSIKENGMLMPIIVRPLEQGYELVAGERRWRAMQYIREENIDAVVMNPDRKKSTIIAIVENIQREDLNIIEEAEALQNLHHELGMNHAEIAKMTGKSRSHVSNILRLNELSKFVKSKLLDGLIEMGHARAVLSLSEKEQEVLINHAIKKRLSVRAVEGLAKKGSLKTKTLKISTKDPDTVIIERELSEILGAELQMVTDANGKGKIIIKYNDLDQLQGIINKIKAHN
jgi:ParB family chromosome partitioning protein|tara:strand:+ start:23 stop:916 length:894 start_codon:yes stop_codon:yes gene_type:complete